MSQKSRYPEEVKAKAKKQNLRQLVHNQFIEIPYNAFANSAEEGFQRANRIIYSQKIFDARDLPYRTQIVPLAAILATLGDASDNDGTKSQIIRWYWCGVLGEQYSSAIESRFAKVLPEVVEWVNGGSEPTTALEANFVSSRLLTLRTRNSAAYKGIHALLMRDGGIDFRTGDPIDFQIYFDESVDIHHIFPKDWCGNNGIEPKSYNSIINKTPLSGKTNRKISGKAPSKYLAEMEKSAGIDSVRMDEIIGSHVIDPALLRADDYHGFYKARESALLDRIEKAIGKSINRESSVEDEAADSVEENGDES